MSASPPQVVLVTGASSGIGEAAVRALLAQGYRVHAGARRVGRMQALREAGAVVHALDVTDETSISAVVSSILENEGRLDVLVNNAGYGVYGAIEEVSIEEARDQFEVNLFGIARLTQLILPSMRTAGSGTIINISSMGGRVYTPLGGWYHASKHALEGWSDCLRLELAPFGIRVVIIEPGAVGTEFGELAVVPLLERSGNGPYAETAHKMAAATRRTFSSGKASPPSLIADLIVKVVRSRRPRTRYVSGYLARPVLLAHRLLGDRFFDLMIRRFL
ncbi:MAG: oxidoreductase [Verrucomicrobiales bacterium]|jgi:NAD(P)-dependent dehydrogenase (short-subunit alcohol dehydrogenase family)|nr:oxidoreductase [Verrucomicrobiales bacterium]MDP5005360.1 oxidoreductase [Verrucomicrobiales bacterium]